MVQHMKIENDTIFGIIVGIAIGSIMTYILTRPKTVLFERDTNGKIVGVIER